MSEDEGDEDAIDPYDSDVQWGMWWSMAADPDVQTPAPPAVPEEEDDR